jgi:1-acyl-sn-glycerol-3-phosphate acyltransferase
MRFMDSFKSSFMNKLISAILWIYITFLILLLLPISFIIWFLTYPFDSERKIMHRWMIFHGILLSKTIPLWKITVEGRNKADENTPYVIICNHQSLLDILILNCLRYRFRWISKIENYRKPVIGWYLRMAKYIPIDRGNPDSKVLMLGKSAESLRKGISIMIFPEGTRSPDGEIAPFKLGAFQLALMTDKPVLPVVIDGTGGVLPKHGLVFSRGNVLRIRVLDPVHPGAFGTADPEELSARFRKIMIEELNKIRSEPKRGI